ncbi:phosphoenolpyruvate--protein phosphotransferase [candidate division WOR-3 bacterium JGI_Cruoil_03_51_56]|uniref:Phosphoenolpyruvate-protein phosphotransferase n=1 Tax=candidate division WOR-3 bacterium JGI_Cruoil_03_51_56 TaxID=1973747 RepID=A0A235BRF2_UNCW3|nr:MAG: phosphoenolpyruvate--protein phosphotransferase [candidate division WOR-3 bacterium JGI_Cruoil_03_51_56]
MTHKREKILRGIPVSHGFAQGVAFVYRPYLPHLDEHVLEPDVLAGEVRRFQRAVKAAERELRRLHARVKREMGHDFAEFIDVQLALLADEEVLSETERFIRKRGRNAEFAYEETLKRLTRPMTKSDVPLFQERSMDVVDVSARVLRHLLGEELPSLYEVLPGSIIIARDLPPSEAALLDKEKISGLVLESGGKTSHTAIMAKAKEIPAVVGVESVCREASEGLPVLVDGYRGLAILNPTRKRLNAYKSDFELYQRHRQSLSLLVEQEPVTADGKMIDLSANIGFSAEARAALRYGARGVGLFRTEYIYLARRRPPTEDEQFEVFAEVAKMLNSRPVIVRTFDLGGDKVIPGYSESNPFLGWRGLRLCFDNVELFKGQLRAILRSSAFGNVKIMFPMVSALGELRRAKLLVDEAKRELRKQGVKFDEQLEIGVMVETPSAAIMADQLAQECSFLSIGSNDLTQYTLAVDRGNERVAELYDHFHPAVLQLIRQTIAAAHRHGIWVGLCGEFASDPLGILVLLGFGIDEMSVSPGLIPEAKNIIRTIDTQSAVEIMDDAMKLGTGLEVKRLLRRELRRRFPKLAEFLFELEMADSRNG